MGDSERRTLNVKIKLADDMEYETGDHFVLLPCVSEEYGERLLSHFVDYDLDTVVKWKKESGSSGCKRFKLPVDEPVSLRNVLCWMVDLKRKPSKQFMLNYSTIVKEEESEEELKRYADNEDKCKEYMKEHGPVSVIDVIEKFPPKEDELDRLLEILPLLQHRTYSITTSPQAHSDSVHLCVGYVEDEFENGKSYHGVVSSYLWQYESS